MRNNEEVKKILFYTCLVGIIGLVAVKKFFLVQEISCYNELINQECSDEIKTQLASLHGTSLFFTDVEQTIQRNNNNTVPFTVATIRKKLPATLILSVQPESAAYTLSTLQSDEIHTTASANGNVVPQNNIVTSIPHVYLADPSTVVQEQIIQKEFHSTVMTITTAVKDISPAIERVEYISPQEIRLVQPGVATYIIAEPVPLYLLQHLKTIIEAPELREVPRPIREIDLRFRLPVLRTEQ